MPGTHSLRLRRWLACTPPPLSFSAAHSDDLSFHYQRMRGDEMIQNAPLSPRSLPELWSSVNQGCLSRQCVVRSLGGRWIMLLGDSTQREIHDAMTGLLLSRYHARFRRLRPSFNGTLTHESLEDKAQSDHDVVFTFPQGNSPSPVEMVLSFRFLRGLDRHKIRHNVERPHQLFLYPEWKLRSEALPTHLLMSGDPPLRGMHMPSPMRRGSPDTLLLHSCAWDLPRVNRSRFYYPTNACWHSKSHAWPTVELEKGQRASPHVHGGACRKRGEGLSDGKIFTGFERELSAMLRELKSTLPRSTSLFVRGCHPGTEGLDSTSAGKVRKDLSKMNTIIRHVARAQCLPLVNVWEIDRQAGYYAVNNKNQDIHVPPVATMQAAVEILIALLSEHRKPE